MTALESAIDELYARPLDEFTAARNALAKSLTANDRARVSRLPKPTLVPWVVNQLYWHSRPVWQRLMESGDALRTGQVAALKGRDADIATLTANHRKALAEAVKDAGRHAADSHPDANELSQMLEAISLGASGGEQAGRFTKPIRPAGFEALAGIVPSVRAPSPSPTPTKQETRRQAEARKREELELAEAQKRAAARLKAAEAAFARAQTAERASRERHEEALKILAAAERELAAARSENR